VPAPALVAFGVTGCLLWLALGPWGCVVERDFGDLAPEGDVEAQVAPYGQPLRVVQAWPEDGAQGVARNVRIVIDFDQYLDPAVSDGGAIRVRSGGVAVPVRTHYRLSRRRLVGELRQELLAELRYEVSLNPATVLALDGSPLAAPWTLRFSAGDEVAPQEGVTRTTSWPEVAARFDLGCGCHQVEPRPAQWFDIPRLDRSALVGAPSAQVPGRALVDPYRPTTSYVMHKVLADYPDRVGTVMPPPWASEVAKTRALPAQPLSVAEAEAVELWILAGATP